MRFKAMFYVKEKGHPVLRICELLRGSRSGFYSFLKTRGKLEKDKNLEKNIESIFKKASSKESVGFRRFWQFSKVMI